jgi:hypothetical protein
LFLEWLQVYHRHNAYLGGNVKNWLYGSPASVLPVSSAGTADPRIQMLVDRMEIVDALYRFGAGQDLHDPALFASAFAEQAALDFTGPAKRLGASMPVLRGRDAITDTIMQAVAQLDTTHTVTNPRVDITGDRASLFALVEAQHLPKNNHAVHLLLKNIYNVSLTRAHDRWVIDELKIDNVWFTGEPAVLFPG